MAASETEDEQEEQPDTAPNPILLKKSSSRDYSRVMCETLTYTAEDQSSKPISAKIERQGSMRSGGNGNTSNRYVSTKRSIFGHHLLGCFPSRSRRSSLTLIPKLVLADHTANGVAEMIGAGVAGSGLRCGSSKGGPAFSRVPADSARGSYSEPTSPQVTCIGQVKAARSKTAGGSSKKKSLKGNKNLPPNPGAAAKNPVLIRSRSSTKRASVSSPLSGNSPARFARSNSRRRDGEDDVLARVSEEFRNHECSYEIDLTRSDHASGESLENVQESTAEVNNVGESRGKSVSEEESADHSAPEEENVDHGRCSADDSSSGVENQRGSSQNDDQTEAPEPPAPEAPRSALPGADMLNPNGEMDDSTDQEEEEEEEEEPVEPSRESAEAATIAQHRQLAIQVCQALAAAVSSDHPLCNTPLTPPEDEDRFQFPDLAADHPQHQQHRHLPHVKKPKPSSVTLKRLDSLNDSSPRACLWMRRSIGRPIALDLSRKPRSRA